MGYGRKELTKLEEQLKKKSAQTRRSAKAFGVALKLPSRLADYTFSQILFIRTRRIYREIDDYHFDELGLFHLREKHRERRLHALPADAKPDEIERAYALARWDYWRDPLVVVSALRLRWIMVRNWTSRHSRNAWVWLGIHKPVKLLDVSWRAVLISIGTFSLVSFAIVSVVNLNLERSHGEQTDSKLPPPSGDASYSQSNEELNANQSSQAFAEEIELFRPAFPVDGIPVVWQTGQSNRLYGGFDRTELDAQDIPYSPDLCSAHSVVIFGTASLDGSGKRNRELARERAVVLSQAILRECSSGGVPISIAVAMSDPIASRADGSQRKAFGSLSAQEASDENLSEFVRAASEDVNQAIGDSIEQFDTVEVCISQPIQLSCAWKMLRPSSMPAADQKTEPAKSNAE